MGFFNGRISFTRFKVSGRGPGVFGSDQLESLASHAIGTQKTATMDGTEVGWIAGDHILDTQFDRAKNIVNDTLQFAFRIDTQKIPADLLKAYMQVELTGAAANNPNGLPSARHRREARAAARERLEQEAADGRFIKRKSIPVLWDAMSRELLVATTSANVLDRVDMLFRQTFDRQLEPLFAGKKALQLSEAHEQTREVDNAAPAVFVPGVSPEEVAWIPDTASRDFLGNEFLLWLWYVLDVESDTIKLGDNSEATVMLARTLTLECPRGQTGKDGMTSDGPARLPEARRAIQAGKMPRKVGLTVVRHDAQVELTLHAETLAVTGAKLPASESEDARARLEDRVTALRDLAETLDLLYDAFCRVRFGSEWPKELAKIQRWLKQE